MKNTPRPKKLHIDPTTRDAAANGVSSGVMGGVVFGLLPKFAAALSLIISGVQVFALTRRGWKKLRKWLKGRKKNQKRARRKRRK